MARRSNRDDVVGAAVKAKTFAGLTCRLRSETGLSLVETAVALALQLVLLAGLLSVGMIATAITENEGHLAARTAEYAQDKMEQLLALAYGDATSNTAVFPMTSTGGTGLAVGGSSDPANPVAGYVDYLDPNGNLLPLNGATPPAGWYYKRVWRLSMSSTNLKQVTVTATVAWSVARGMIPQSTMATLKSAPF